MKSLFRLFICVMSLTVAAQQPAAPKPPAAPAPPGAPVAPPAPPPACQPDPEAGGQPINIRLDVSVIDQRRSGALSRKR